MMSRLVSKTVFSMSSAWIYEFCLDDLVPPDHLLRKIDAVLDLSWLRGELKSHYSTIGRPSICPELMIRMLLIGYRYSIRSKRRLCQDVKLNLASVGSAASVWRTRCRTIRRSRSTGTAASGIATSCARSSRRLSAAA